MSWERYKKYYLGLKNLGFGIDISRVNFDDAYISSMEERMNEAFASMRALEAGAIANPDENRMVGHYWLRTPSLAPTEEIKNQIEENVRKIKEFARKGANVKPYAVDGLRNAQWVAMDYADVLVHVFMPEAREFYNLETLWADARLTQIPDID